jgi:hypothetical protein
VLGTILDGVLPAGFFPKGAGFCPAGFVAGAAGFLPGATLGSSGVSILCDHELVSACAPCRLKQPKKAARAQIEGMAGFRLMPGF